MVKFFFVQDHYQVPEAVEKMKKKLAEYLEKVNTDAVFAAMILEPHVKRSIVRAEELQMAENYIAEALKSYKARGPTLPAGLGGTARNLVNRRLKKIREEEMALAVQSDAQVSLALYLSEPNFEDKVGEETST